MYKCIDMDYNGTIDTICNMEEFHYLNTLVVFLLSSSFGILTSFICTAYFVNYEDSSCFSTVVSDDEKDISDMEAFTSQCNEEFNNIPNNGYVIDTYPFVFKIDQQTPFGNIVMFLNVYKNDYIENNESIEYTYYSQSNGLSFNQLLLVTKKIAIALNTTQFYSNTIHYTKDITGNKEEPKKENDIVQTTEPTEQPPSNNESVFAKFKKYNKGSMSGKATLTTNNKEVIDIIRMKRIGTIEDYKSTFLCSENLTHKNISYTDFVKCNIKND